MFNVGNLFANLSLVTSEFTSGLNSAIAQAKAAGGLIGGALGGSFGGLNQAAKDLSVSTKDVGSSFKDVSRIVQGIMISQVFYAGVSAIKDATSAVFKYNAELENTNIAFKYLLGSASQGTKFVTAIQDFAATTPFTTQTASNAARMLMSMGFAANQVLPTLRILSDASAVSGATPEMFNRIVYALGQIKTTGKLMTRDLMQLAQAGIPVYDILQKKLGLTADQMRDIGKQGIDSGTAIKAILDGLQERYKGASQEVSKTTSGLLSTFKDDFLIIGNILTSGISGSFRNFLNDVVNGMEKLRSIGTKQGLGGLINAIFPPEMQIQVRAFASYVSLIIQSVGRLIAAIAPVGREFINAFVLAFNAAVPAIILFLNVLAQLISVVTSCTPALRALVFAIVAFRIASSVSTGILMLVRAIQGLSVAGPIATIVSVLAKAIRGLAIACLENPLTAVIAVLCGVLLSLALSCKSTSQWLDRLAESLGRLFGFNVKDLWNPKDASAVSNDISQFYGNLSDLSTGAQKAGDDASKGAGKAGKGAKQAGKDAKDGAKDAQDAAKLFVASFDEIHQIPDDNDKGKGGKGDGGGDGGDPGGGDGGNPGAAPTNMPTLPTVPDFKPDSQQLPPFKWPVIPPFPPFPPIPPLPKIPVDDWGKDLVKGFEKAWEMVRDVVTQPWPAWSPIPVPDFDPIFQKVRAGLGGIGNDVIDGLKGAFGKVPSICVDLGNKLATGIQGAFNRVPSICADFGNKFSTNLTAAFGRTPSICADFGNKLATGLQAAFAKIPNICAQFGVNFSASLAAAGALGAIAFINSLQPMRQNLNTFLAEAITGFGIRLTGAINGASQALLNMGVDVRTFTSTSSVSLNGWFTTENAGFTNFATSVRTTMATLWQNILTNTNTQWQTISTTLSDIWATIEANCTAFGTYMYTTLDTTWTTITTDTNTQWTTISTYLETTWSNLETSFATFGVNMKTSIRNTWQTVTDNTTETWSAISSYLESTWNTLYADAQTFGANVVSTIQTTWSRVQSNTSSAWSAISSYLSSSWSTIYSNAVNFGREVVSTITNAWNSAEQVTSSIWSSICQIFASAFQGLISTATSGLSNIGNTISSGLKTVEGFFSGNKIAVLGIFAALVAGLIASAGSLKDNFGSIFGAIAGIVEGAFAGIRGIVGGVMGAVMRGMNEVVDALNNFHISVPSWVPGFGGDSFGFSLSHFPIPGFANGGIIDRDQIIRVGEGNKREAIVPLQNAAAMAPFADAIAAKIISAGASAPTGTTDPRPVLYVGSLIADDRSLKKLERKLQIIRVKETQRKGR